MVEKNKLKIFFLSTILTGLAYFTIFSARSLYDVCENSNNHIQRKQVVVSKTKKPLEQKVNKITKENFIDELLKVNFDDECEANLYKKKIEEIIIDMDRNINNKLQNLHKAKIIYDYLHDKGIFKDNNDDAYTLKELLDKGTGNCLNKPSLFALFLDRFNVNYDLYMLSGDHCYFIIDNVDIELTNKKGFDYKRTKGQLITKKRVDRSYLISGYFIAQSFEEIKAKNYEKAIIFCDKAISIQPKYSSAYLNKGIALKDSGKLKQAKIWYEKALELNPDGILTNINYAIYLKKLGEKTKALKYWEKAENLAEKQNLRGYYSEELEKSLFFLKSKN